ncbi:tRNA (guanosine(46)-N7)-methyltransferase TrmB [bacterium]|nr:tRNA (guanosine(46)-N7)-methyltransferase TrmB [bacterium]
MGKDKLRRFAQNQTFRHVIQPERQALVEGIDLKGNWNGGHFEKPQPLILELGCGGGEYTVGLARRQPEHNIIGIDIKGARIWKGAVVVEREKLPNAAFLRSDIELIEGAFGPDEVSEIWITFPDPQIKHRRAKHRLLHPDFLERYRRILKPGGRIHLKTDSEFLYGYTEGILHGLGAPVHTAFYDIDAQSKEGKHPLLFELQTLYEQRWRSEGKPIAYLEFSLE